MGITLQILIILGVIIFAIVRKVLHTDINQEQTMPELPHEFTDLPPTPPLPPIPKKTVSQNQYRVATPNIQSEKKSTSGEEEQLSEQEFNIHSSEEVRRAIIWSEILNRKY